jgi:hypothetical protein
VQYGTPIVPPFRGTLLGMANDVTPAGVGTLPEQVARMRQLCSDLDAAIRAADLNRDLLARLKRDADEIYAALTALDPDGGEPAPTYPFFGAVRR